MAEFISSITEYSTPFFNLIILILNFLSIFVLIWGVALAMKQFIRCELSQKNHLLAARENSFIKNFLGSYVLLSLEILIAADIIESIINPTVEDIFRLAAVVLIRTVISYFLNREIESAISTKQNEQPLDKQK